MIKTVKFEFSLVFFLKDRDYFALLAQMKNFNPTPNTQMFTGLRCVKSN